MLGFIIARTKDRANGPRYRALITVATAATENGARVETSAATNTVQRAMKLFGFPDATATIVNENDMEFTALNGTVKM